MYALWCSATSLRTEHTGNQLGKTGNSRFSAAVFNDSKKRSTRCLHFRFKPINTTEFDEMRGKIGTRYKRSSLNLRRRRRSDVGMRIQKWLRIRSRRADRLVSTFVLNYNRNWGWTDISDLLSLWTVKKIALQCCYSCWITPVGHLRFEGVYILGHSHYILLNAIGRKGFTAQFKMRTWV